jgi:hypothetical protein
MKLQRLLGLMLNPAINGGFIYPGHIIAGNYKSILSKYRNPYTHVIYNDLKIHPIIPPHQLLETFVTPSDCTYNNLDPYLETLSNNNKYIALIYDNVEELYKKDTETNRLFLNDLQIAANTDKANLYILLCGRTHDISKLVYSQALYTDELKQKYKLKPMNLNCLKFPMSKLFFNPL